MRNCNLTWTWWLRSFSSWISYCTTLLTVPLTPPDLTWTVKLSRKRCGYEGFNTNFSWSYKTNHQIVKQMSFYKIHHLFPLVPTQTIKRERKVKNGSFQEQPIQDRWKNLHATLRKQGAKFILMFVFLKSVKYQISFLKNNSLSSLLHIAV